MGEPVGKPRLDRSCQLRWRQPTMGESVGTTTDKDGLTQSTSDEKVHEGVGREATVSWFPIVGS